MVYRVKGYRVKGYRVKGYPVKGYPVKGYPVKGFTRSTHLVWLGRDNSVGSCIINC